MRSFFKKNDVDLALAKKAWKKISRFYSDNEFILFEIFNEPAPSSKAIKKLGLSALTWKEWKKEALKILKVIRRYSNNPVIVSPTNWAYNIKEVIKDPIKEENILYSLHPYPIHKDWKETIIYAYEKIPFIITEFAFKEKTSSMIFKASRKNYGKPIFNLMNKLKIPWIAWCYDDIYGPRMLLSWKKRPTRLTRLTRLTKWGKFTLLNLNK